MDFGIAKAEGVQLTRAGFTLGTPYYMAPEQVLGQPLTPQADVYAFGILLFELLAGAKPIAGNTVEKIFHQILYEPIDLQPLRRRISARRGGLDRPVHGEAAGATAARAEAGGGGPGSGSGSIAARFRTRQKRSARGGSAGRSRKTT